MRLEHQRIFNYDLIPEGRQMIHMPKGAQILNVIDKDGFPFLLVAVDEQEETEIRIFRIVTTGEYFNREILDYIGTLRLGGELKPDGKRASWYTMHVFEVETAFLPLHSDPVDDRFKPDLRTLKLELDNIKP